MQLGDVYAFDESAMQVFTETSCQRTTVLYEHAISGSCDEAVMEKMIDDLNESCCVQGGENVCSGDGDIPCNAVRALRVRVASGRYSVSRSQSPRLCCCRLVR